MLSKLIGRIVAGVLVLGLAVSAGASFSDAWQKGRYKKEGAKCVWDPNDSGADQCRPAKGRFKKEGTACVWTPSDSGPDQCDPRQAK